MHAVFLYRVKTTIARCYKRRFLTSELRSKLTTFSVCLSM